MHLFIDESGDCGVKRKSSADYFSVAAVLCSTSDAIATCEQEIQETRVSLGLPRDYEFHFARIKDRHRREFLGRVAKCEFTFAVCYLDKAKAQGNQWRDKITFYESVIGSLADASIEFLIAAQTIKGKTLNAKVIADKNNDPVYFRVLREKFLSLRAEDKPLVDKMKPGRSRSSDLLQLADMICGAVVPRRGRLFELSEASRWKSCRPVLKK